MSAPLIMCITNTVAENFSANCLLAVGARPAMIHDPGEAAELARAANAVLVNVGTVDAAQAEICRAAAWACSESSVPWVLDPVAFHLLSFRRNLVSELLKYRPTLIRGNSDEIDFLYKSCRVECLTLATGKTDVIFDGSNSLNVEGGVEMLQMVTATGCAQGAICAAFLGMGMCAWDAAEKASSLMKKAGEIAYGKCKSPGSFKSALIDALYELK